MRIEGRRSYAVGKEVLWSLLQDPLTLARIFPGCEQVESVAPDEFRVSLNIRVGQSVERLTGALHLDHLTPFQSIDFRANGENPNGGATARGRVVLEPEGDETTAVRYEIDIDATGGLALISPRMLETTAKAFVRRCLEGLEKQVAIRTRVFTTSVKPFDSPGGAPPTTMPRQPADMRGVLALLSILMAIISILWITNPGRRGGRRVARAQEAQSA